MLPVLSQNEADLTACFAQEIGTLLDSFSEKDTSGKQSLQQMFSSDRSAFSRASIRVLARATGSAGTRYVLHLLRKENLLIETLADPRGARSEDAMAAARLIPQISAPIESDLEKALSATLARPSSPGNAARVLRLLELLEATSAQPRFYLFQTDLLNYPDSAVRSRSALLIACGSKSAALVGRLLLDEDLRVQANAVEALWTFDPAEAHPLLLNAARSRDARVAGNAAVGLYRAGDLSGLRLLFRMAQQEDPARRATAAWAMGETADPRFLPFLTTWFSRSCGEERVNILQALGRIRRREKSLTEAGEIEIRAWGERVSAGRRLTLSLRSAGHADLSSLKPTQFAIWEGDVLVEDYEVCSQPNPALAISGFVLPRFSSAADPYAIAALDAVRRCLKYKRPEDLWRLDRYLSEPRTDSMAVLEKAALPYDEALLGSFAKVQQRGFLASPEVLRKIIDSPGPKERAADDVIAAFERQSDAMIKFSGKRRLFLFLSSYSASRMDRHLARLSSFVASERITLHGFVPQGTSGCDEFEGLCRASDGGTFATVAVGEMADEVERLYAQSINRYEVTYRGPGEDAVAGSLQISSNHGCGRVKFSL